MNIFRYRIITNLQCNNRCSFCYQTFKPKVGTDIVLSLEKMTEVMDKIYHTKGKLKRATLMGGETLLLPHPEDYVKVASDHAETVCLVTNGRLLTEELVTKMVNNGLKELAISIYSLKNFNDMFDIMTFTNRIVPNMRVNIPRSDDSSYDKLKEIVELCLDNDFGCVVCEDLMGRYGEPHDVVIPKWDGVKELKNEFNFITYLHEEKNKEFGLFAHYTGYDDTDVIITPMGNFCSWEKYCNKIDNYELC